MWREGAHSHSAKVRRRRSLANITTLAHSDMEEQEDLRQEAVEVNENNNSNSSFSESLRLFQSLQVLANEEDREALRNETTASMNTAPTSLGQVSPVFLGVLVDEADYCFSSLMFSSVVGVVTLLMIMSGVSISLLCTRLRRERREGKETASDVVHTLRSEICSVILTITGFIVIFRAPRTVRSEYVHSPQARIP